MSIFENGKFHIDRHKLGRRFAERRAYLNLSQEKLAEMVGVTHNTISKIETQGTGFSVQTFFAICKALKTDPNFFLCGIETNLGDVEGIISNLNRLKKTEYFEIVSRIVDVLANAETGESIDIIE